MTDNAMEIALKYVREELATLRNAVHDEVSNIRSDLNALANELRTYTSEQGPRIAVLDHRVTEIEKDVNELKQLPREDKKLRLGFITAIVVAVLSWVPHIINSLIK